MLDMIISVNELCQKLDKVLSFIIIMKEECFYDGNILLFGNPTVCV